MFYAQKPVQVKLLSEGKRKIPTFEPVSLTKECRLTFLNSRLSSSILCIFSCTRCASRWVSYSARLRSSLSRSFACLVDRLSSETDVDNWHYSFLVFYTVYKPLGLNCLSFFLSDFILNSDQLVFFRANFSVKSYFWIALKRVFFRDNHFNQTLSCSLDILASFWRICSSSRFSSSLITR